MTELEQLRGECALLREALTWITDCWGRDDSDYCRADMQGAIENGRQVLSSLNIYDNKAKGRLDFAAYRLALCLAESDPEDFSHDLTTEDIDHIVSLAVVVMAEVFP